MLFFAGGPGQGAATLVSTIVPALITIAPHRDLILFDQRGTGRRDQLARCFSALQRTANLQQYGTAQSADDAADVLGALRIAKVNVVAGSYGTRLAGEFMRRYPALVQTTVLRAAAAPDFNILGDGARYARDGLTSLLSDCARDPGCAHTHTDPAGELNAVRSALRAGDATVTLDQFDRLIDAMLLTAQTRQMIPGVVHTAATRGVETLVPTIKSIEAVYATVSLPAYLSIACAEDRPRLTAAEERAFEQSFSASTDLILRACDTWRVNPAPPRLDTRAEKPTLVISGELHPAMPPAAGARTLARLAQGRHLIIPATSHSPLFPGCAADLVRAFIDQADASRLEPSCLARLTLPPFK